MTTSTVLPRLPRPGMRRLDGRGVARTELVTPAMCGPNSLFVGQIGDWTWDAVSAAGGADAYTARDGAGNPTYLSFYYFRVRGSRRMHPQRITFGDRLQVVSRVFGLGSESALTLHRIRPDTGAPAVPIEPDEFYGRPDPDCLYVENVNRWIARTRPGSNQELVRRAPPAFEHRRLPVLPQRHAPREAYAHARTHGAFDHSDVRLGPDIGHLQVDYPVEASRDLNGVGLLYFASYFSIVDWALLRLWRHLGRTDAAFLDRIVLDQQLCYLGNADADAVIRAETRGRPCLDRPGDEVVDIVLRDRGTATVLAVCSQLLSTKEGS